MCTLACFHLDRYAAAKSMVPLIAFSILFKLLRFCLHSQSAFVFKQLPSVKSLVRIVKELI